MTIFTAPATYAEAAAMMGGTFTFPDGVSRRAYGAGSSGVHGFEGFRFSVSFEDGSIWSSETGFETKLDRARRLWDAEFAALADADRKLIGIVFPNLPAEWTEKTKSPARLVLAAKAWAVKTGKIDAAVCGRCGGSGKFSFNQMHGDTCYGCHGSGKKHPATRDTLRALKCA